MQRGKENAVHGEFDKTGLVRYSYMGNAGLRNALTCWRSVFDAEANEEQSSSR